MEPLKKAIVKQIFHEAGLKSNGSAFNALNEIIMRECNKMVQNLERDLKIVVGQDVWDAWEKITPVSNNAIVCPQLDTDTPVNPKIRPDTLLLAESIDEHITTETQIRAKPGGRQFDPVPLDQQDADRLDDCSPATKRVAIQIDRYIEDQVSRLGEDLGSKKAVKSGRKRKL